MSEQVKIIKLSQERWIEWKELRQRALREEPQAFWESLDNFLKKPDNLFMQQIQEAYLEEKSWRYFAEIEGKLVGVASGVILDSDPKSVGIFDVFVVSEARGKGIFKLLMGKLLKEIKSKSEIKRIELNVNKDQLNVVNLYKRCGFETTGEESVRLGDGKYHDVLIMKIDL